MRLLVLALATFDDPSFVSPSPPTVVPVRPVVFASGGALFAAMYVDERRSVRKLAYHPTFLLNASRRQELTAFAATSDLDFDGLDAESRMVLGI